MSTFSGKPTEIPWVSIDKFDGDNLASTCFFLSHCHSDHMEGIRDERFITHLRNNTAVLLYCSDITATILRHSGLGEVEDKIVVLPIDGATIVRIPAPRDELTFTGQSSSADKEVSVTLVPAGHCPGSVMFLFEGDFGTLLYTGDFRLAVGDTAKLMALHNSDGSVKSISSLYLDTTFIGNPSQSVTSFPSRELSATEVCRLIREWLAKGTEHIVNLHTSARFGSEYLFVKVAREFGTKIHVSENQYKVYQHVPEIADVVTSNPDTRIHSCIENIRGSCVRDDSLKIRNIKPAALWWYFSKNKSPPISMGQLERCKVAYSCHCSHVELKDFVTHLRPSKIEPCVIPEIMNRRQVLNACAEIQKAYQPDAPGSANGSTSPPRLGWQHDELFSSDDDDFSPMSLPRRPTDPDIAKLFHETMQKARTRLDQTRAAIRAILDDEPSENLGPGVETQRKKSRRE